MDRLRRLLKTHPGLLGRQPLLKHMLTGLNDQQADAVANVLEILIAKRAGACR